MHLPAIYRHTVYALPSLEVAVEGSCAVISTRNNHTYTVIRGRHVPMTWVASKQV